MNKVYLIGNHLGNYADFPARSVQMLESAALVIYEQKREFDWLITAKEISVSGQTLELEDTSEFNESVEKFLEVGDIAIISDLGYPVLADAGWPLLKYLSSRGHEISIIPGPSIAPTAQAVAIMDEQHDRLIFLPLYGMDKSEIRLRLESIKHLDYNIVLLPHPDNIDEINKIIAEVFGSRPLVLIRNLTMDGEAIVNMRAHELPETYTKYAPVGKPKRVPLYTIVIGFTEQV